MLLTTQNLYSIFDGCIDVLSNEFQIAGITVNLMGFILFDVVSALLLWIVFSLFNGK